jgi:glycine cleavage system aminomethyltransferase T
MTSGAYGHSLGAAVGQARVAAGALAAGETPCEVLVKGVPVPALLSRRPFYDPDGKRLRG